jgi:hypothetical protein
MNNIMKRYRLFMVILAFTATAGLMACAQVKNITNDDSPPRCPSQLTVQQSVDQKIDGWEKYSTNGSYSFLSVFFSKGAPENRNILSPSRERKVNGVLIAEWNLPKSKEGYWVSCVYKDTGATVVRKLADDVAYCEAEHEDNSSRSVVKQWSCSSVRKSNNKGK